MFKNISIVLFFSLSFSSFSQEQGKPYITNYTPKDYKAATQNWAIVQDNRGVMYFANNTCVIEYDGKEWRNIPVSNNSIVRSLAADSNGTIYVGAVGEFGFLLPDEKGNLNYKSLSSELDSTDRSFADVWQTFANKEFVFFGTQQVLYIYHKQSGKISTVKAGENNFHVFFMVHQKLYVRKWNEGLMQLENQQFELVKGGEKFSEERIYVMLPYKENKILMGTRSKGLFIFSPSSDLRTNPELFIKLESDADEFLLQNQLYHGAMLENDAYALATIRGGVIIIGKDGKTKAILNKQTDLQDDFVFFVCPDNQSGLWVALNTGISRVEINSPISLWGESSGLKGEIESIIRHKNILYIATSRGVYYLTGGKFQPVSGIESQSWDLIQFDTGLDKKLLVATSSGVYEINLNKSVLINELVSGKLLQSKVDRNKLYVGLFDGLMEMFYESGKWISKERIQNLNDDVQSLEEDKNGNLWISTRNQGIARFKDGKVKYYDPVSGVTLLRGIRIFKLNNQELLFATEKGVYVYDQQKDKFNYHPINETLVKTDNPAIWQLAKDKAENLLLNIFTETNNWIELAVKEKNGYRRDTIGFKRLPSMTIQALLSEEDQFWIGGTEGLFQYKKSLQKNYLLPFNALIRKVSSTNDSILFYGTYFSNEISSNGVDKYMTTWQSDSLIPELDYAQNSLNFNFSAPYFDGNVSILYSYFLEGYDNKWSAWDISNKKEYTNLPEGTYRFKVRAKNIYGVISNSAEYQYIILPPWYRTFWAFFGYLILFATLIYILVQLSVRSLKKSKIKLELTVKERTAEITNQNIELHHQKAEIEHQKKEITDSINYAERIQRSILPPIKQIQSFFPDSFVLFKPKDIVSGDFYSFFKVENPKNNETKFLIAAADCTGHGVPGAFMSVVGSEKISAAVKTSDDPGKILQLLNKSIKIALRQSDNADSTRDGMDIALCGINLEGKKMYFSGANRPLWLIRKENKEWNLTEYKPTKSAIGGLTDEKQEFETLEIDIKKDDRIYLSSDGYADQFGGEKGKKMMTKNFKEKLLSIQERSMKEQEQILEHYFVDWKSSLEQVDDVLVIALKI